VRVPKSAAEVAQSGEFVVLCLPDSTVPARVAGEIAGALERVIVVDTTTGGPEEMERIGRMVPRYVDATIAGSSGRVRSGEAVIMAGGGAADVEACGELFAAIGRRVFHVGPVGAGARMKLTMVNLVLGLNRAALAEGLASAGATGVDPAVALEVLRAGRAADSRGGAAGRDRVAAERGP
jgi:3-hydroxyisobutyrate dehydrogenase-like beta-hydroxyacid dehydrogenase